MQQTEKYQFNLIEGSDPFSAQPLNDNMEKVEGALTAHRAEVSTALTTHRTEVSAALTAQAAQTAALPHMIVGSYDGTGEYGADHPTILEFPEAGRPPQLIFVVDTVYLYSAVLIRGMPRYCTAQTPNVSYLIYLEWTDKGVRFYSEDANHFQFNSNLSHYNYVALY